jgi:hypothetical protein
LRNKLETSSLQAHNCEAASRADRCSDAMRNEQMSGSNIVNIASTLPCAIMCSSTPLPGQDPTYSVALVGQRHRDAVNGVGITYGVDGDVFAQWIALYPDYASSVSVITDEELDALKDPGDYGYEAGL